MRLSFIFVAMLYPYTHTFLIPTADGVPYVLSVFAENSAGNGTKCNVTDFTDELSMLHYCMHANICLAIKCLQTVNV